jgi:DNA recombination protein RmuC
MTISEPLAFIGGFIIGAAVVLVVFWIRKREAKALAREIVAQAEDRKIQDLELFLGRVRESFGTLSLEALSRNTDQFLSLAQERLKRQTQDGEKELEGKKRLIDRSIEAMREDLEKVRTLVVEFEKDRDKKFGHLDAQLKSAAEQTARLQETTGHLREALASSKARGQWGERMAEDVLRLAGFVEGVNYLKQKTMETSGSRPDFTFLLPNERRANMDVKFPLAGYMRFLESETDLEREAARAQFQRDVRGHVKAVTTRDYINPEAGTLDYVLLFIPNEQIYAFINQNDPGIIDDALKSRVILCSPFTLFAILAIIRQAMDTFNMEKTAGEILRLIGSFRSQWGKFVDSMSKMGGKLDEAQAEYQRLVTTRRRQLERPLDKIDELRKQRGLEPAELPLIEAQALPAPADAAGFADEDSEDGVDSHADDGDDDEGDSPEDDPKAC